MLTAKTTEAERRIVSGTNNPTATQRARFERLWQQHRLRVWRLCARLAGNTDAADDLTQEVSLRAFQSFGSFRGEASVYTWLYRIAVNVVNRHRERRRELLPLDAPEVAQLPADMACGPEPLALQAVQRAAVWSAIERLPEEMRTTLILQVYEQLRYREVAAILNVPVGTVKSRLNHAIRRRREEFRDDEL